MFLLEVWCNCHKCTEPTVWTVEHKSQLYLCSANTAQHVLSPSPHPCKLRPRNGGTLPGPCLCPCLSFHLYVFLCFFTFCPFSKKCEGLLTYFMRNHAIDHGGCCPPGDIWQRLGTFLVLTPGMRGWVLLAWNGWRPGMLLNFPQSIRQSPTLQNDPASHVIGAEAETPAIATLAHLSHPLATCLFSPFPLFPFFHFVFFF